MRTIRRRIRQIEELSCTHCGDVVKVGAMFDREEELVRLIAYELEQSYGRGLSMGLGQAGGTSEAVYGGRS